MARVYTVQLGGKEWPLSFSATDAIELKRRFGKPLTTLIKEDVMGYVERPKPDGVPGETHWVAAGTADLEVQIAFLQVGIRNERGEPGEKKVTSWVDELLKAEQDFAPFAITVWKACMVSGITGRVIDLDAGPEAEGKA